jgi:hypothetical protein
LRPMAVRSDWVKVASPHIVGGYVLTKAIRGSDPRTLPRRFLPGPVATRCVCLDIGY